MRYRLRTLLIVVAVGPVVLAALLSRFWPAREPSSVAGRVTYLGRPLSYALVKFEHDATPGRFHVAIADREGRFRVETSEGPLNSGRHFVRVYRRVDDNLVPARGLAAGEARFTSSPGQYRLATDPKFTTVIRSGANKIDIELKQYFLP
jgi:hypothetical protein